MSTTLELLLNMDIPKPQTKKFKMKRLSQICEEDVIFELRELGFSRVAEIKNTHEGEEMEIHIVLAGVIEPDFKNKELLEKYKAVTPAELVKKLLLPGEITNISWKIEELSGYRVATLEEIKKN